MKYEEEYWDIVLKFLKECTAKEAMEYVVGHNYDMGLAGLWYLAKNHSTERGVVANVFWQLANSFNGAINYEEEKELAIYISDNFLNYSRGEYGSTIDIELKEFLMNLDQKFSKELMDNIPGEIIGYPIHTYEGLPEYINNEIKKLQKNVRKSLP